MADNYAKQLLNSMSAEQREAYKKEHGTIGYQQLAKAAEAEVKDANAMTRAEFHALDPMQRAEFFRNGGKLAEPEPEPIERDPLPEGKIYRLDFDQLDPIAKSEFFRNGGKLVD